MSLDSLFFLREDMQKALLKLEHDWDMAVESFRTSLNPKTYLELKKIESASEKITLGYPHLHTILRRYKPLRQSERDIAVQEKLLAKELFELRFLINTLYQREDWEIGDTFEEQVRFDRHLDEVLGITMEEELCAGEIQRRLERQYGREQFIHVGTHYEALQQYLKLTNVNTESKFYDLGSGVGRVVIYTALATQAQCKGIEIVNERVEQARIYARQLRLTNVEFIESHVLKHDFSDATHIFMFDPFSRSTAYSVVDRLKKIASHKAISIGCFGNDNFDHLIASRDSPLEKVRQLPMLTIYGSK